MELKSKMLLKTLTRKMYLNIEVYIWVYLIYECNKVAMDMIQVQTNTDIFFRILSFSSTSHNLNMDYKILKFICFEPGECI